MPKLIFQQKEIEIPEGTTILQALIKEKIDLPHDCEQGYCGTDAIVVIRGQENLSPPFGDEADNLKYTKYPPNVRMACSSRIYGDVEIEIYY